MPTRKRLFVGLICSSLLLVLGLVGLVFYLLANRDLYWNQILLVVIGVVLAGILIVVAFGVGGIILTLWSARTIPPLQGLTRVAINLMYPVAIGLGKLLRIGSNVIQSSFVEVNNQMVRAKALRVPSNKILLLAPHCLQRTECPHKITIDVQNCKRCELCTISALIELAERYGAKLAVATGGTFARRFVEQYRPRAIVAIACERDLSSGILDTNPLPVLGVLNQRPHGPCMDTGVDLEQVEKAILYFIGLPAPLPRKEDSRPKRVSGKGGAANAFLG
ncbi:MAG: DUF116 domain-containing protein [Syntrophomonadaceae bacterium]|nr:DUF116 domain-containing protein [Syntrophomonadaceae bacterium]